MNLRPVIERELRVASRQRSTYLNRTSSGVLLTILLVVMLRALQEAPVFLRGRYIFSAMTIVLLLIIWLTVPLSTADCLSREKREDTLGLLLLTPLRPFEIVLSKVYGAVWQHGLLLVALIPVQAIPVLLGGVTPLDLIRQIIGLLTALVSAVTVGIVASSVCERRGRAWLLVVAIGAVWLYVQLYLEGLVLMFNLSASSPGIDFSDIFVNARAETLVLPVFWGWLFQAGINPMWASGIAVGSTLSDVEGTLLVFAITAAVSVWWLVFATRRVRRFAESRFLSARRERFQTTFTRERYAASWLRRGQRRQLDRNPVTWMQGRRWSHRLTKWGWLLFVVALITLATFDRGYGFLETVIMTSGWIGGFMLFSLLLLSSGNLQADRDSGALELLLVTPLTPVELARGRLAGFRRSFLPAATLVAFAFWYYALLDYQSGWSHERPFQFYAPTLAVSLFFGALLWFMPMIGLCFSLNRPGLMAASLNTAFFSIFIPWLMLPCLVGFGGQLQVEWHRSAETRDYPFWVWLAIWMTATLAIQLAFWRAGKGPDKSRFPSLMPAWFRRWRLGWIAPWLVPMGAFAAAEMSANLDLFSVTEFEEYRFVTWLASGVILLAFLGRRCRLALVRMLEDRSFATSV